MRPNHTPDGARSVEITSVTMMASTLHELVRKLELENAELRYSLAVAKKDSTKERAERHLARYRAKRRKASNDGDLTAAASADQRVRALEALLNP